MTEAAQILTYLKQITRSNGIGWYVPEYFEPQGFNKRSLDELWRKGHISRRSTKEGKGRAIVLYKEADVKKYIEEKMF